MDTLLLSRIQFAANITFHILFPMITISLGWLLLFFKFRYSQSKRAEWMKLYFFFTKVFALTFALGVVSGITMSFQFGTNWPGFMNTVGNIAGPLLAYEVLTAFFLEATFLGIMLYGFKRVPGWVHTLSTFLVAFGTTLSAFWILVLNSWMQTPVGFEMVDGVAHATDWLAIIFNPSMPYRFFHSFLASALTVAFLVLGVMAYRKLRKDQSLEVDLGLRVGVWMAFIFAPLQGLVGDFHGVNTRDYQPAKLAAMEALWEGGEGVGLTLFAIPDKEERENHFALEIPKLGSFIITRDFNGYVMGLDEIPDDEEPPVVPIFWAFRIMVGVGMFMILMGSVGFYFILKKKEYPKLFLKVLVGMTFSGWVATVAGWYVTEIGRQPWLVYGVLKTKDAVATVVSAHVGITLVAYLITYAVLLVAYIYSIFFLARKQQKDSEMEILKNA